MPIFEFKCGACGEKFEKLCFNNDKDQVACPKCGSQDLKRCFSTFNAKSNRADGSPSFSGGSSCSTCSSGSCATCH